MTATAAAGPPGPFIIEFFDVISEKHDDFSFFTIFKLHFLSLILLAGSLHYNSSAC